jgi:outer membrane protein insertion porin family
MTHAQQSPRQQSYKILGISVEGNVTADPSTVILTSGLRTGDEIVVPGDATQKAITKLWDLRMFSDIQLLIDKQVGEGMYLKILVEEHPRLDRITITGNDEFSQEDIEGKIGLIKGQILRPVDFNRIQRKLLKAYEEEGYMLAKVDLGTEVLNPRDNRAEMRVTIDEGPEVDIAAITFSGNEAFEDSDLRGAMDETSEDSWWRFWRSSHFDRENYRKDKKLVLDKYREEGFLDAEITGDSIWYNEDKTEMHINLRVDEGQRSYIRNIVWKGNTVYPDSLLSARLGFESGDVFNAPLFEMNLRGNPDQTDVGSLYLDNGYLRSGRARPCRGRFRRREYHRDGKHEVPYRTRVHTRQQQDA